ncbi:helicase-associated domain-containing protein [Lacisediminihabitans sp. H27-G8]|uniref:helicase-associated domain-containing protein n=1 Tax=Lacisediminihabitans sp. H27-G8 TaxID=3111909 RepID=UPI0038FC7AC4
MSDTLSLATRLRAMDDTALAATLRAREISPSGIKDFFDLAEAFLDRASVQQILMRLDRETLAVLAAIGQLTEETGPPTATDIAARLSALSGREVSAESISDRVSGATALLLVEAESHRFAAYGSVRDQLRSWPAFGLPSLADLASTNAPAALEPVPDVDRRFIDRLGAERAFAAITAITELLVEVERDPARELAKGGVALPDSKRLAHAMSVDLESVAVFLAVADRAGLVARETGSWMITDSGGAWLQRSTGARWATLGAAWFERLPADIRQLLGERTHALWGSGLRGYIDWLYPAGGDWMDERIGAYTRDAELLGITANQAPTGPGSLLLADGIRPAEEAMTALLPAEVEQVYLQHDLSVVAPGPLTPRVDARLRSLADVESRALASSYRVSTSSVNRAMAAGETAESILEFLGGISLTGIPQPLNYLIGEASSRYGQVRVGSIADPRPDARSYIRSDDELLIGTILVDQSLSSLGFERTSATRVQSRFPLDVVFWSLSDARYPVAAEDAAGEIVALRRQRHAKAVAPAGINPVDALIERLRLGGEPEEEETGHAWLIRQLDAAIKAKTPLTVTVTMPNGTLVDYQLEPTSVAGGRLRGRDNRAAIERTLPLSRIAGISPAK